MAFRSFLMAMRKERGWNKKDLAVALGVSQPSVALMESRSQSGRIVESVHQLKKISDIKGIDVDEFVSIIIGKKNEIGENSFFLSELATEIEKLDPMSQVILKLCLKDEDISKGIDTLFKFLKADEKKKKIFDLITALEPQKYDVVFQLLTAFVNMKDS